MRRYAAAVILHSDDAQTQQLVAYVAPEAGAGEVEGEHISYWQNVNTQIFGNAPQPKDLTFNITGWSNSYTGLPFADVEMQEWVESTVAAILALQPKRVLEIGCGTGLLLSRIAPHCEQYMGVDFSPEVLANIHQLKAADPALSHVTLEQRSADNLAGLEAGSFDLVILNSVIQYFPTVDYLRRVLSGAVALLQAGGKIFVGDVRSLPHLTAYHAAVQLTSADNDLTRAQFAQQVQRTMQEEEELVIDPRFFVALPSELPQLADVEIQLKRGNHVNELMQFRYSATLHVAPEHAVTAQGPRAANTPALQWLDWEKDALSLSRLQQFLTVEQPPLLGVRHMPNRRVQKATKIANWLADEHEQTVGDLLPQLTNPTGGQTALDPEEVWALGAACGYEVAITWSELGAYRSGMDVLFKRPDVTAAVSVLYNGHSTKPPQSWSTFANSPLQGTLRRKLAPQLHEYLNSRLPGYMVPNTLILLDALPLNNSGKVDRRALPAPTLQRSVKGFTPPTTPLEKKLAAVWCEILGVDRVSIHDDFFDLGAIRC
ncbi:MAG: methyltransferase [Caldilineaceae bacterium]